MNFGPLDPSTTPRPRVARGGVLILGGGFAGSNLASAVGAATVVNPTAPAQLSADAELVLGTATSVDPEKRLVEVESGGRLVRIAYAELVLALGPVPPVARRLPLDHRGRVVVDETLRVIGASHIWALGDCAAVPATAAANANGLGRDRASRQVNHVARILKRDR